MTSNDHLSPNRSNAVLIGQSDRGATERICSRLAMLAEAVEHGALRLMELAADRGHHEADEEPSRPEQALRRHPGAVRTVRLENEPCLPVGHHAREAAAVPLDGPHDPVAVLEGRAPLFACCLLTAEHYGALPYRAGRMHAVD